MIREIAQKILDEQGYIVIGSFDPSTTVGSVVDSVAGGPSLDRLPGPLYVIGESNMEEYLKQKKFFPEGRRRDKLNEAKPEYRYFRAVAE